MIYFDVALFVLCLASLKINKQKYNKEWLSITQMTNIKGIFIIIVFLSHMRQYISANSIDTILHNELMGRIGQRMVVYFLVCSGFGVMENIKKKGKLYISAIPHKRVLNVIIKFDIVVCIYILVDIIINRTCSYSISHILLSFTGWESVGNSNWYVFAIIYAYIVTWIAYSVTKKHKCGIAIVCLLSMVYIVVLFIANKGTWWYDTILCYPVGMLISLYKEKIEKVFSNNIFYIVVLSLSVFCTFVNQNTIYIQIVQMLFFAVVMILGTMYVSFCNPFLEWCGRNLFGMYILQRIPMIVLKELGFAEKNIYLYTVLCFIICCVLALIFNKLMKSLENVIYSKIAHKEIR